MTKRKNATPEMIDVHCHILPDLDDGPVQIAESLAMCHQAISDDITDIIATPHVFDGVYKCDVDRRDAHIRRLNMALQQCGFKLTIHPGAEVRLAPELRDDRLDLRHVCLNRSRYMLVELPSVFPAKLDDELFSLQLRGIVPILAHPERYHYLQHDTRILQRLASKGVLFQITAQSLLGNFGDDCQRCAERLIHNRMAHIVASDAHSTTIRPPLLSKAREHVARIAGAHEARAMFVDRPLAVLNNQPLKLSSPPVTANPSIFNLFDRLATML